MSSLLVPLLLGKFSLLSELWVSYGEDLSSWLGLALANRNGDSIFKHNCRYILCGNACLLARRFGSKVEVAQAIKLVEKIGYDWVHLFLQARISAC